MASDLAKDTILRYFNLERQKRGPADCEVFPEGVRPQGIPLDPDELVYGEYKSKYFFTPQSLFVREQSGLVHIRWRAVKWCTSSAGDEREYAELRMTDGSEATVRVADLAHGWKGQINQLFHVMIDQFGPLGAWTVDEFFAQADDYSLAPNLEPHPTRAEFRQAIKQLQGTEGVVDVWVVVRDVDEDAPYADALLVVVSDEPAAFVVDEFAEKWRADGVLDADERTLGQVEVAKGDRALLIVWD